MCDGAHTHEVAIGLKQNTEAVVRPALDAARAAESTYGACQVLRKTANAAHNTADNAAKVFITNAKKRLSKFFGEAYTTEWGAAGWPNNSTGMPSTQAERFSLINSLKLHFTATPAHESTDMEVTAALATALQTVQPEADRLFEQGDYTASLQALAALKAPVDAFFDDVMVNAEDPALRANRLGLLKTLHGAMNRVADLSRLAS